MKPFFITTPIYYVNAKPHIGHTYTTVAADVLARYKRMRGEGVLFATGTDEHGIKVATAARENGRSPREHVDLLVEEYRSLWDDLGISYDVFIRTTEGRHRRATQHLFRVLLESGDIYRAEYEGWYCVHDETYLSKGEVADGLCPNPECRRPVTWLRQPSYFFRTSKYAPALKHLFESNPDLIGPESRRNEVLGFIEQGVRDTCVSRSQIDWGIPVPGDEESVIYVWFDALTNYLTVCGYPDDEDGFRNAWPPDVQLMAKDILQRFHGTLWPAMLMAAGLDLPKRLFAHGFWTVERRKISKSIGNVIYPSQIAADLAAASGSMPAHCIDAIRYFLLREVPFGLDGDFSVQALAGRFNADLANDLSNLLNRTLPVLGRVSEGCIPSSRAADSVCEALSTEIDACGSAIEALDFSGGLVALWRGLAILNKYLDQEAPWSAGARRPEAGRALYTVLDGLRAVSTALVPFMPKTGSEILRRLGVPPEEMGAWENACSFQKLAAGWRIAVERPLFQRFPVERLVLPSGEGFPNVPASAPGSDREAGGSQVESPGSKLEEPVNETSESISMEDFSRADMRVGTVVQAERVSGTDRLISLVVDTGGGTRTVVAGIGDKYEPEGLLNKQLIVVTNLPPVRIRGIISEGMILAVGEKSVEALLTVDRPVGPGAKVR